MGIKIIAEVGECFNGDMNNAFKMIRIAKEAGCDIVKFQVLDMEKASRQDPEYEWFRKVALGPEEIGRLCREAGQAGIDILFTPVSLKTARWIAEAGQEKIKIASSFLKDKNLLRYIAGHFKEIYVSTGMASLDEIVEAAGILKQARELVILHCISEYPTGPLLEQRGLKALSNEDVHLNMMNILKGVFPQFQVGYSDHTAGIMAPVVAAAMGAAVIEKHITLDRETAVRHYEEHLEYMGTDHVLSLEPHELNEMVRRIREVEAIKGPMEWERSEGEKVLLQFLRGRYGNDA